MNVGIHWIEHYAPKYAVSHEELERRDGCIGKYRIGLELENMCVWDARENVESIALTAVARLLWASGVDPMRVGRIDVGSETLLDKSKSLKTVLMAYFERSGNTRIEGHTHVNACYGGTAALFSACAWVQSEAWNGTCAIVVAADTALYEPGPARATGGAGAVAMLVDADAPLVLEPFRVTHSRHVYDFYKPCGESYPRVDGKFSQTCYIDGLARCAADFGESLDEEFDHVVFHAPYGKLVRKAWTALCEHLKGGGEFATCVEPSMMLARQYGNSYTASIYACLASLLARTELRDGARLLLYSYGSGYICSLFSLRSRGSVGVPPLEQRLSERIFVKPSTGDAMLDGTVVRDDGLGDAFVVHAATDCTFIYESVAYGQVRALDAATLGALPIAPAAQASITSIAAELRAVDATRRAMRTRHGPLGALDALRLAGPDYADVHGRCCENVVGTVGLPVGLVGPVRVNGAARVVPMATVEGCLVASTCRGCKVINACGGATARVLRHEMTRAPVFEFGDVADAADGLAWLDDNFDALASAVRGTSRFARLVRLRGQVVGRRLYARLSFRTGAAMGMNMASKATEAVAQVVVRELDCRLMALSGNVCCDKKAAYVNVWEGRGCSVVVDATLSRAVVEAVLHTTPEEMCATHVAKNLIGSALAGAGAAGANAHAANVVAAVFIACGQDAAQVITSSACLTHVELKGSDTLHVSCTMPCLEVGLVGGGTHLSSQAACLELLVGKAVPDDATDANVVYSAEDTGAAACGIATAVLAAELSLLAALCSNELVSAHLRMNR